MMNKLIDQNVSMWTTDKENYLLVYATELEGTGNELVGSCIFERRMKTISVFEVDEVALELKRRMYAAGVPLVRLKDVMHLFE